MEFHYAYGPRADLEARHVIQCNSEVMGYDAPQWVAMADYRHGLAGVPGAKPVEPPHHAHLGLDHQFASGTAHTAAIAVESLPIVPRLQLRAAEALPLAQADLAEVVARLRRQPVGSRDRLRRLNRPLQWTGVYRPDRQARQPGRQPLCLEPSPRVETPSRKPAAQSPGCHRVGFAVPD